MPVPVSDLFDTYDGVAAVIGGGPSTLDDLAMLPDDCLKIAVNHHYDGDPDFVVALDDHAKDLISYACPKIGQHDWCDYSIHDEKGALLLKIPANLSATKAAMLGVMMGASDVWLCGIDCYSGSKPYYNSPMAWDEYYAQSTHCERYRSETHQMACADRWADWFKHLPQVKPVSGLLVDAWGRRVH